MRPSEVLDRQADLLSRLEGNDFKVNMSMQVAREARTAFPDAPRDLIVDSTTKFVNAMHGAVKGSYAYRVTEDMVDLVRFAASQLDEEDTFDRSLAPTGCGFVRFDKPLVVGSWANGKPLGVNYLVWGPGPSLSPGEAPRTVAYWFADPNLPGANPDDDTIWGQNETWAKQQGPWDLVGWDSLPDGRELGPKTMLVTIDQGGTETVTDEEFWKYAPEQENDARLLHAFWLLLNQTITVLEDEEPDRAGRKRAIRKQLPPRVTVVRLRRATSSMGRDPGESHVEWQHRWIVRGHWRWQACGPKRSERRRIWVHPFVKGPDDKPLKQSEKVYSLDR